MEPLVHWFGLKRTCALPTALRQQRQSLGRSDRGKTHVFADVDLFQAFEVPKRIGAPTVFQQSCMHFSPSQKHMAG